MFFSTPRSNWRQSDIAKNVERKVENYKKFEKLMWVIKQREVLEKTEKDTEVVKKWYKNEPEAQVQQQKQKKPPKTPPKA